ncbi:MAG: hypothetical protein KFH87_04375 [Bacteroidetes bacterium]|nr:hypothetical protein [Bacteroidota bacterium]
MSAILSLITSSLLAYVDPGTGSFIAQMLIAGFLGFLFMIRSWLYRIWSKLRGKPVTSQDD